jgi:hypothetical protein
VLRVPGLSFERIARDSKIGIRLPRVEAAVTFLAPVRAETEQQEHSVKRTRGTRAPYILAPTGRALMLRFAHRTAPDMRPTCYQLLSSVSGLRVQAPSGAAQQASCSCGVVGPPLKKPSTILWNGHLRCPTSSLPRLLRLKASAMDVTVTISAERDQVFVCGVTQPASRAMLSDPSQAIQ